jgi:prepilin-type N-terminal cleavage/methylation domain-containing protein
LIKKNLWNFHQKNKLNQAGVTLIELLVAMVIFSFVIGISYSMLNSGSKLIARQTGQVNVRNDVRMVLTQLTKDIQEAANIEDDLAMDYLFVQANGKKIGYYYDEIKKAIIRNIDGQESIFLDNVTVPFTIASTDNKVFNVELNTLNKDNNFGNPETGRHELIIIRRTGRIVTLHTTGLPTIEFLYAGGAVIKGTAERNAIINVSVEGKGETTGETNENGIYEISVSSLVPPTELVEGDKVIVTAIAPGKLLSPEASRKVSQSGTVDNGLMLIEDENGNTEYVSFVPTINTPGLLIITSSVGQVSGNINYSFSGDNGLILQEGFSIDGSDSGNSSIEIKSIDGSVEIYSSNGLSTGNSSFTKLIIEAGDNIIINDVKLEATNQLIIKAGGNIFANRSTLSAGSVVTLEAGGSIEIKKADIKNTANNSGTIRFISGSTIYISGLKVTGRSGGSYPGKDATAVQDEVDICGRLTTGTINGRNNYPDNCE